VATPVEGSADRERESRVEGHHAPYSLSACEVSAINPAPGSTRGLARLAGGPGSSPGRDQLGRPI
jgi:hypothetical protein